MNYLCPACKTVLTKPETTCPYCGVAIAAAPPPVLHANNFQWAGETLMLPKHLVLPTTRCLFCAGRDHIQPWNKQFTFAPPWLTVLGLVLCLFTRAIGLIIVAVIYLSVRKVHRATLPRCGPCKDRMTNALVGGWLSAIGSVIVLPAGLGGLGHLTGSSQGMYFGVLGGLLAALILLLIIQNLWINRRTVVCRGIDDHWLRIKVPRPDLTRAALSEMSVV